MVRPSGLFKHCWQSLALWLNCNRHSWNTQTGVSVWVAHNSLINHPLRLSLYPCHIFQLWPTLYSWMLRSAALLSRYAINTFSNNPLRGSAKSSDLILVGSKRPICFPSAWLHRRRSWWGRAVAFTSGVTDWVTVFRQRMVLLWKGPLCSPLPLQSPCLEERYFTSALWTGPNALTPYPELSFP